MKTLFIPSFSKEKFKFNLIEFKKLPSEIAIFYSIQFKELANEVKTQLSSTHKIITFSQTLGCLKPNFTKKPKAILLIGSGEFHAISLALETNIQVYVYRNNKLHQISKSQVNSLQKKKKSSYINYLNSDNIGIIISTKPGQQKLKNALSFKQLKDKKYYLFISDYIRPNEFENFPQIQSWINTACPRLDFDSNKLINLKDL